MGKNANGFSLLELKIQHEKELRQLSEENRKLALEKQAVEYQRRLDELNHSHEKALEDKAQFLQKNLYEASQMEYQRWKIEITKAMAIEVGAGMARQRIWAAAAVVGSLAVSLAVKYL